MISTPRLSVLVSLGLVLLGSCAPLPAPRSPEAPEAVPGEVSFDSPRNQVYLPVMIGGEGPFFFILDTGVDPSAIDLDLALRLGLPVDTADAGEAAGAGTGSVTIYPATVSGLRIGERPIADFPAVALNLSPLSERLGRPLHGILGYSFLRDRVVQIDYPARVLRLFPDGIKPVTSAQEILRIPLVFRGNDIIPMLEARVNGRSVPVSLDTGSGLTLEIFSSAVERLGLTDVYERATPIELTGARGTFEARTATVDSVAIGAFFLPDAEVTFSERTAGAEEGRQGNLGGGFLRHLVVTLDYQDHEITIARPPAHDR
jgi:predicted aspartyl protease